MDSQGAVLLKLDKYFKYLEVVQKQGGHEVVSEGRANMWICDWQGFVKSFGTSETE